ncbi:MAG: magnesium transporter [Cyanobacteriota bacterium]
MKETISYYSGLPDFDKAELLEKFKTLDKDNSIKLFINLNTDEQIDILEAFEKDEQINFINKLSPDHIVDIVQHFSDEKQKEIINSLESKLKSEVIKLTLYPPDKAGGLMNSLYTFIYEDFKVIDAIPFIRKQAREAKNQIYYIYVVDKNNILIGVLTLRDILIANDHSQIKNIMDVNVVSVLDTEDQEYISRLFSLYALMAIPVVDKNNQIKGVITADDMIKISEKEATEDIHKMGGTGFLDSKYLETEAPVMLKKRAFWLSILFLGEMLTATAMSFFEDEIAKATVLALFIPLIISSGGNSGSQASTLVVRSIALGELKISDWFKVFRKEVRNGLILGLILGLMGMFRVFVVGNYGIHSFYIGLTVSLSLIGVVLFGTLAGSMLPFILKRFNLDPATASAPLVATMVDVTGLVIYFVIAKLLLSGTLL